MTVLEVRIDESSCRFDFGDATFTIPIGPGTLANGDLRSDPPAPEELTNAIGVVVDHLDDLLREVDGVGDADSVVVRGPEATAAAAVEVGGPPVLPMSLTRAAAEDVFRTLATEPSTDRRRNPGLDPALVATVVGGCCVLVGIMRRLQLDTITVGAELPEPAVNGGSR